jgi:hypothetical protein
MFRADLYLDNCLLMELNKFLVKPKRARPVSSKLEGALALRKFEPAGGALRSAADRARRESKLAGRPTSLGRAAATHDHAASTNNTRIEEPGFLATSRYFSEGFPVSNKFCVKYNHFEV